MATAAGGSVVAVGETHELQGFALAGATVVAAASDDEMEAAWTAVGEDVGLLILSARAAMVLGHRLADRPDLLTAVMP